MRHSLKAQQRLLDKVLKGAIGRTETSEREQRDGKVFLWTYPPLRRIQRFAMTAHIKIVASDCIERSVISE